MTKETDNKPGNWPDFIGIGAIKSGTTWLHACLAEHPEIYTPGTKELEFFSTRYELGSEWYRQLFSDANGRLSGESTPAYLHSPECAARIYDANPQARLIVCLRNPADRAFSHFMMANRESRSSPEEKLHEFDSAIRNTAIKYAQFGLYANQLKPFFDRFGKDNIHIVLFDDIEADPSAVVRETFDFLGVDNTFVPDSLYRKVNPAARYRNAAAFSLLRKLIRYVENNIFAGLILWMKTSGIRDRVLNWWRIPQTNLEMLPETRKFLDEFYSSPNHQLERLISTDLSRWKKKATTE